MLLAAIEWDKWTAIGTLVLAGATFVLAGVSAVAASAARRGLDLARREIEGTLRPVVVDVPEEPRAETVQVHFGPLGENTYVEVYPGGIGERRLDDGSVLLAVPIRNVGPGAALYSTPHASLMPNPEQSMTQAGLTALVIPPSERSYLLFKVGEAAYAEIGGQFYVEAAYTDAAGGQFTRTHLFVMRDGGEVGAPWRVRGISLFHGHDSLPFVYYGQGWDWVGRIPRSLSRAKRLRRWMKRQLPTVTISRQR